MDTNTAGTDSRLAPQIRIPAVRPQTTTRTRFPGVTHCAASSPLSKRYLACRLSVPLTLKNTYLSPVGMPLTRVGNPGRPVRSDVADRPAFFVAQLCTQCWPRYRRPLRWLSRLGPHVEPALAGFKDEPTTTPARDALRPSNLARNTPFVAGLPPRGAPTLGVGDSGRRRGTAGYGDRLCSTGRSMGPVYPFSPTRSLKERGRR